eukprot:2643982-Pyramimonas_sp.AAC.1
MRRSGGVGKQRQTNPICLSHAFRRFQRAAPQQGRKLSLTWNCTVKRNKKLRRKLSMADMRRDGA